MNKISEKTLSYFDNIDKNDLICDEFFTDSFFTSKEALSYYYNEINKLIKNIEEFDLVKENGLYRNFIVNEVKEDIYASLHNIILMDKEDISDLEKNRKHRESLIKIENFFKNKEMELSAENEFFIKDLRKKITTKEKLRNNEYFKEIIRFLKETEEEIKEFISEFISHPENKDIFIPLNVKYKINNEENNDIKNFIDKKLNDSSIEEEIELTKSQKYNKLILFKDKSILLIDKNDDIIRPKNTTEEYQFYINDFFKSYLDYYFRKKPKYKEPLIRMFDKENNNYKGVLLCAETILKHESLIKSHNINIISELENKTTEQIDDLINEISYINKINKFAYSIMSKKYKHLYDQESFKLFKKLYEMDLTNEYLQQNIGKKLAAFNSSEELNEKLIILINNLEKFNLENYIEKSRNTSTDIITEKEDLLILKINDYSSSKKLGSASWCISRNEHYFKTYSRNREQYFIYDFSKESLDNNSIIGLTLEENGSIYASHSKDDSCIKEEPFLNKYIEIIKNEKIKNKKLNRPKI